MMAKQFAYPDLHNKDQVYNGLVGFGLFTEKLPSCFTSKDLIQKLTRADIQQEFSRSPTSNNKKVYCRSYITYSTIRNTNVARIMAVPHPAAYIKLCETIADNWDKINKVDNARNCNNNKTSFCHVRYYGDDAPIFKMNYTNGEKCVSRKLQLEYSINAKYLVKADIANCFPSIYTHSIPWALAGSKQDAN